MLVSSTIVKPGFPKVLVHSSPSHTKVDGRLGPTGFGNGGEGAEAEVLARLLQERPIRPELLLTSGGGRVAALAALADALEFVADSLCRFGEHRLDASLKVSSHWRNSSEVI